MNSRIRLPHLAALTLLPACIANAEVIVSTSFTGRTISGTIVTITDYTLNGIASPGDWIVVDAGGFMTSSDADDHFAVADNAPTWSVTIPLAVGAQNIALSDVTIDFESFGNSQASKIPTNFAPFHYGNVRLLDSGDALIAEQELGNEGGDVNHAPAWIGVYTGFAGTTLNANENYSLQFVSRGAGGNNVSLDAFSISGTIGGDVDAPDPDPMSFAELPIAAGQFSITMAATAASDPSGVEYLFTNTTLMTDSGWLQSPAWTDTGLTAGTEYSYTVKARDRSSAQNETGASDPAAATTEASDIRPPLPDPMSFAVVPTRVDESSITMTATTAADESGVEYFFENLTLATDSGWQVSPTWTDTELEPSTTYSYQVTARDTSPSQLETASSATATAKTDFRPVGDEIFATSFIGRVIGGTTATLNDSVVNGVSDPGSLSVTNAGGFYVTPAAAGFFAPQDNPPTWSVDVPLAVGGASIVFGDAVVDFQSFNNAGAAKTGPVPAHTATVTLLDPSDNPLGSEVMAGPGDAVWDGTYLGTLAGTTLTANQTYTLRIELDGSGGNNVALEAIRIRAGAPMVEPQITAIEHAPQAIPNPTVILTWRKTGAVSYIAKEPLDMTDWDADLDDGITAARDENPGDPDHITVTFPLIDGLENATDLFFRIEEG